MNNLKLNDVAFQYGIRVYCLNCKAWFDPRTEKSRETSRKRPCSHPIGRQRYKSTIDLPTDGFSRKRVSRQHKSKNLDEVILLGYQFKMEVKSMPAPEILNSKPQKPTLLLDCLVMFLDYKKGLDGDEIIQKSLSRDRIRTVERSIEEWKKACASIGEKFSKIKVNSVSKASVRAIIELNSSRSNSMQKKAFGVYKEFYRYLNVKKGYAIMSPFASIVVSDSKSSEARALIHSEYNSVVEAMKSGTDKDKFARNKQAHFDWYEEAMEFCALSGRRREEFMVAKFSDIELVQGELLGGFIRMIDFKYSKQNKHKIGFNPKYTKAPIYPEMQEFLMKMGYGEFKGTDRYIICADETVQRNTLCARLTRGFGFYRDKLGIDKKIQLKGLRKTYITRMRNEFGDNANFFTGHSDGRIDKIHYYDISEMLEKVKEFRLWKW